MGKDIKVGIVVTAKDETKAAMVAAAKGFQGLYDAGAKAFGGLGQAIQTLDHGMNVVHKGVRMVEKTFGEAITASLAFRDAADPLARAFKEMTKETDRLKARLGDALLPILTGLGEAFRPSMVAAERWLEQNRKMIASKLLEWLSSVGSALITGVANGVVLVAKAWAGWSMIIDTVRLGVNSFFDMVLGGVGSLLGAMGRAASALKMEGVGSSLSSAGEAVKALSAEFGRSAEQNKQDLGKTVAELDSVERKIQSVQRTVSAGWTSAVAAAGTAIQQSTQSGSENISTLTNAEGEMIGRVMKTRFAYWSDYYSRLADMQEKNAKTQQAADDKWVSSIQAVGSIWGQVASQMVQDGKFSARAIALAAIKSAETLIMTYAAISAAAAGSDAVKKFGVVGIAIGAAAAGVAFALIESLVSRLPSAAQGMTVTGGVANQDSVLVRAMPGERIFTKEETRLVEQRGGVGAGLTVVMPSQQIFPDAAAQERHIIRYIIPTFQRAIDNGWLRLPAGAR